jgi:alkylhydroperoxidase/carboxymuconolactone decarboxylase family protein YurZ
MRRRTVQHQQENIMARLPFVEDNTESKEVRAAFEAARRFNGRVANSMRLYAHSPAILKFLLPLQAVLQKDGLGCKIDAKTRALAMIKVSALNECKY